MATLSIPAVDVQELRQKVQAVYVEVAEHPEQEFHFETGRRLAERLGYDPAALDRLPSEAIDSFAGVGHYFHLAAIRAGESVLDLGSGSGMDSFLAALQVGPSGRVIGLDMTDAQRHKAERLARRACIPNVTFQKAFLEELPLDDGMIDVVISNGVVNLCPDKAGVFQEVARVLRPGGRLALADIVTEKPLPEGVTCDASLWAACIGGAAQEDDYRAAIAAAGPRLVETEDNPQYQFLSRSAQGASRQYGVKSVSLLAVKQRGPEA